MSTPPTSSKPLWSTPKFLVLALLTIVGLAFVSNVVSRALFDVRAPSGVVGAICGVVVAGLLPRWKVIARRAERRAPPR